MSTLLHAEFEKRFRQGPRIRASLRMPAEGFSVTALFGPSGCGKTTILRCLAGLERPEEGRITFGDETWFDAPSAAFLPPQARGIGYLFQEYMLFPHLTVAANIGFGVQNLSRKERRRRVAEMLNRFQLSGLENRLPREISGGEQQRVALARAVIRRPRLLLLDEPLSALDAPTRLQLRRELRGMLRDLGLPAVVVTHDPMEAISLADHVLIMDGGKIRQSGTVQEVFSHPDDLAVARIVGVETVVSGRVVHTAGGLSTVAVGAAQLVAVVENGSSGAVDVCIRAEDVVLQREDTPMTSARNRLHGVVRSLLREGSLVRVEVDCGFSLTALITRPACEELALQEGSPVLACIKATAIHVIPRS